MTSISSIALSGLNAATLNQRVAAHNVANVSTEGFTRQRVVQHTQPAGGVSATVANHARPGENLAEDLVNQLQATYTFKAGVMLLKAEDERLGTLLDLRA